MAHPGLPPARASISDPSHTRCRVVPRPHRRSRLKGLASFCEQMTAQLKHIISVATAQHDFWSPNLRRSLLRFDRLEDENCIEVLYGAFEPT
jgi:hypothetical protein